jgi:hypothetical protein
MTISTVPAVSETPSNSTGRTRTSVDERGEKRVENEAQRMGFGGSKDGNK